MPYNEKEYQKKYRELHSEKIREYFREYSKINIEKMRGYRKKWREKNSYKRKESDKKYQEKNVEKEKERHSKYRKEFPEKMRESSRKWREKNLERERERNKKYNKEHPEKAREYQRKKRRFPKGRIDDRMGHSISQALKGAKAGRRWETLVGYTVEQLKQHLQNKFTKGMTWAKFMAGEIHIDHVVPKSHFKYTTAEDPQFKECWALHNLQPLWAKENLVKSNKIYQLPLL
jgi:DNA mismatch repair ATPase MutL